MGSFPFVEIVLNSTRHYRRGPQVDMSKHHIQSRFPSPPCPSDRWSRERRLWERDCISQRWLVRYACAQLSYSLGILSMCDQTFVNLTF